VSAAIALIANVNWQFAYMLSIVLSCSIITGGIWFTVN